MEIESDIIRFVTYPESENGEQYVIQSDKHREEYHLVRYKNGKCKVIKSASTPDVLEDYVEKKILKWQCALERAVEK